MLPFPSNKVIIPTDDLCVQCHALAMILRSDFEPSVYRKVMPGSDAFTHSVCFGPSISFPSQEMIGGNNRGRLVFVGSYLSPDVKILPRGVAILLTPQMYVVTVALLISYQGLLAQMEF